MSSLPAKSLSDSGAVVHATGDATLSDASATIGEEGGVVEAAGVRLTIPSGALRSETPFSIRRVAAAELPDWPMGTQAGFLFTPSDQYFRVPATIELPHDAGEGEVICQTRPTDRMVVQFEVTSKLKFFPVHVVELPRRCAVSPKTTRPPPKSDGDLTPSRAT